MAEHRPDQIVWLDLYQDGAHLRRLTGGGTCETDPSAFVVSVPYRFDPKDGFEIVIETFYPNPCR